MPLIINIYSVNHFSLHLLTILLMALIKGFFVFIVAYFTIPRLKNRHTFPKIMRSTASGSIRITISHIPKQK